MRSRTMLIATVLLFRCASSFGQGAETFKPTETIAPNIPGVVAAGTKVVVVAQGLRGTEGPIAAPDGALLLTEQQANVITKIDAKGTRSTFLRTRADPRVSLTTRRAGCSACCRRRNRLAS